MTIQSNSLDLVAFQQRLNKSLDEATRQEDLSSLIGFHAAGRNWLVDLGCLREIESVPPGEKIHGLSLAKPWVYGISNFKGHIYTLVDFQSFLGVGATKLSFNSRALLFHNRYSVQAALVVQEVSGLVSKSEMPKIDPRDWESTTPWSVSGHRSEDGRIWEMLSLDLLADSKELLEIEMMV